MSIANKSLIKSITTACVIIPAILLTSGCAIFGSAKSIDPNDKTLSLVFGHFDMEDAPSWGGIDWVTIKQYKPVPAPDKGYFHAGVEEGLFWHLGITQNSSIQVDKFGRDTRFYSNATYTYNFGGQGRNQTARVIKTPGIYYLGSYKYKNIDSGSVFKPDNFEMVKADAPTEKELLKKLLKKMEGGDLSKYTHQKGLIEKRLKQLK